MRVRMRLAASSVRASRATKLQAVGMVVWQTTVCVAGLTARGGGAATHCCIFCSAALSHCLACMQFSRIAKKASWSTAPPPPHAADRARPPPAKRGAPSGRLGSDAWLPASLL